MPPIAETLRSALGLHQQGQLAEAEKLYRKVLKIEPRQFEALNLLGMLKHQQGDSAEALRLMDQALGVNPNAAETLMNYGGVLCLVNRHQEAIGFYDRALVLHPDQPEVHYNRATALMSLNRFDEALAGYDRALTLRPDDFLAHYNRGITMIALVRFGDALVSFERALALRPNFPDALINRGKILRQFGRLDEALAGYDRALAIRPDDPLALVNRGIALLQLNRPEEALASLDRALVLKPGDLVATSNRGAALVRLNRPEEGLAACDTVLALNPAEIGTLNNRGIALTALGRHDEALTTLARALSLEPTNAELHWSLALTQLSLCNFAEGWKEYEWRWQAPSTGYQLRNFPQAPWAGQPIQGALLVWGEQGLGDEILYGSMVPELAGRAGSVILEVEPRLVPLFARSYPDVCVIARGDKSYGPVEAQLPLASLGQYLRPNLESFPQREHGYLSADPKLTAKLRRRLSPKGETVVGISWISTNKTVGKFKSARLGDFEPLLRLPACCFVDLQYGDTRAEREALQAETGIAVERLEDIDNTGDLDSLAALMSACDLVVTVSNTTAHMAGALGRPTWVLAPHGHSRFWYWFKDRPDSPWYPKLRIKRQTSNLSWRQVVAAAADEIAPMVKVAERPLP
jgi:tetratricopeptide (TPR) repeat protein